MFHDVLGSKQTKMVISTFVSMWPWKADESKKHATSCTILLLWLLRLPWLLAFVVLLCFVGSVASGFCGCWFRFPGSWKSWTATLEEEPDNGYNKDHENAGSWKS